MLAARKNVMTVMPNDSDSCSCNGPCSCWCCSRPVVAYCGIGDDITPVYSTWHRSGPLLLVAGLGSPLPLWQSMRAVAENWEEPRIAYHDDLDFVWSTMLNRSRHSIWADTVWASLMMIQGGADMCCLWAEGARYRSRSPIRYCAWPSVLFL